MEQVIGVGAAVAGDMASRPNYGLNELDFVFSTLIVGSLMNFSLMYLLAPTEGIPPAKAREARLHLWATQAPVTPSARSRIAPASRTPRRLPPPQDFLTRFVTGDLLAGFNAPTGHMFEAGSYSVGSRLTTVVYKALQFGFIGFFAGIMGTATTNGLIALRQMADPSFKPQNKQPALFPNAGCWALHMSVSSNLRYQARSGPQ